MVAEKQLGLTIWSCKDCSRSCLLLCQTCVDGEPNLARTFLTDEDLLADCLA